MNRLLRGFLVWLALVFLAGCAGSTPGSLPYHTMNRVTVQEGLPHPGQEPQRFQAERAGPTPQAEVGGYWMYEEPLTLATASRRVLLRVLGDPASYRRFSGEKKCGGFHPDYAVSWYDGNETQTLLICLSCGEAEQPGRGWTTRFDLAPGIVAKLRLILDSHRTNRPQAKVE